MMKGTKVVLIIIGVIIILGLIFFAVFMKFEDFEDEYNKYYEEYEDDEANQEDEENKDDEYTSLEELPEDYTMEQAIKDGCVVISYNGIYNNSKLNSFITNTNANSENRQSDHIRFVRYTIEGDAIITDLEYKADYGYILTTDNTRDAFGADTKITVVDNRPAEIYSIALVEDGDLVNINLTLRGELDYDSEETDKYEQITIASYSKDSTLYDTAPSFIGTITAINNNILTVSTEDEIVGDLVSVSVEDSSEYEVGDKIEVFYTGTVNETYPSQIDEIDVKKEESLNIEININKIKNMEMISLDSDVETVDMTQLSDEFSFMENVSIPEGYSLENNYIVYTRESIKIEEYNILHDYVLNYRKDDFNNIIITFSKVEQPIRDYYIEEGEEISKIGDVELNISQWEEMYIATFEYKDIYFDVETTGITEEQLVDLLESIIERM